VLPNPLDALLGSAFRFPGALGVPIHKFFQSFSLGGRQCRQTGRHRSDSLTRITSRSCEEDHNSLMLQGQKGMGWSLLNLASS